MKKWARGLVVCAAAAVLSIGAACMAYAAEGEINVNGTGVVQADPDTADISLEISTDGKAAQAAQKENNRITAAVTKAMTDLNVKKDDIVPPYTPPIVTMTKQASAPSQATMQKPICR